MKRIFAVLAALLLGAGGLTHAQTSQDIILQGDHGKLSAVLQAPAGKTSYPLVLIFHGFNASKEMYLLTELAQQLQAKGIGVLLFDFNGHGKSEGSFLDMTIPNELEDARCVYAYASKLPQVTSISAVGHSQGSLIAALLAGELGADKIKTIVLMAPATELKEDTAKGDLFGVTYDPQHIPPYITLPTGLKVGCAFLETTPHIDIDSAAAQYTGPVLIVHSKDDQLVPYRYGKALSKQYAHSKLKTLHGFDHNFTQNTPKVDKIVTDYLVKKLLKERKK